MTNKPSATTLRAARLTVSMWVVWILRLSVALVLLECVLMLLMTAGFVPSMLTPARVSEVIAIRSVEADANGRMIVVKGTTPRQSSIVVRRATREIGRSWVRAGGAFEVKFPRPEIDTGLTIEARSSGSALEQRPLEIPRTLLPTVPPSIALAYYLADLKALWVVGRSGRNINLEVRADSDPLRESTSDWWDTFEVLQPAANLPARVTVGPRRGASDNGPASVSMPVTATTSKELPLSRIAEVTLSADEARFHGVVTLPVAHPLVTAAIHGVLSGSDVAYAAFGDRLGYALNLSAVTTDGEKGVLTVDGPLRLRSIMLFLYNRSSLASQLLFSPNDSLTVVFNRAARPWFDGLPPATMAEDRAVWKGPRPLNADFQRIEFEWTNTSDKPRQEPEDTPRPPAQHLDAARDFLVGFETQYTPIYVAWPIWLLKSLIPFIGFLYLLGRGGFSTDDAWRPFVVSVAFMAVWQSWPFVWWLFSVAIANRVSDVVLPALYAVGARGSDAEQQGLPYIASAAFWLIVATVTPLVAFAAHPTDVFVSVPRHHGVIVRWAGRTATALRVILAAATAGAMYYVVSHEWLLRVEPGALQSFGFAALRPFESTVWAAVTMSGLFTVLLLTIGIRASLFGACLVVILLKVAVAQGKLDASFETIAAVARTTPWWTVAIATALSAWALLVRVVRVLLPPIGWRARWSASVILVAAALGYRAVPTVVFLALTGSVILASLLWVVVTGLDAFEGTRRVREWIRHERVTIFGLVGILTLFIAWPVAGPEQTLRPGYVAILADDLRQMLVYALALGVILYMRREAQRHPSPIVSEDWLRIGVFFFATFLVNSATSLLFVPIPFIVGLLVARFWLFKPLGEVAPLADVATLRHTDMRRLIERVIQSAEARTRFAAIRKKLEIKLQAAELAPADYDKQLGLYQDYLSAHLEAGEAAPGVKARDAVFALGHDARWTNVKVAVAAGALLAAAPVAVGLYQYLPSNQVRYPYPLLAILLFLIEVSVSWLLYAFFLGYYYAHIRGTSGLAKGVNLWIALMIPFTTYRVLSGQSLTDMWPFFLWSGQVFLFCTVLGLVAFDYRVLRTNGFRARDLVPVHNFFALSAYGSTVAAALASALVAVLTNRVPDLVKFVLQTFGRAPK